jgi:hypothetical protein
MGQHPAALVCANPAYACHAPSHPLWFLLEPMGAEMGIDSETFQLGAAAKAAGVPTATVKTWMHLGRVTGQNVTGGRDEGNRRAFPFHTVMETAVAKTVLDIAFHRDLDRAFEAAQAFAHTNAGFVPDITSDRRPGFPFATGQTLLCASLERARIVNLQDGQDMAHEIRKALGAPVSLVIVDLQAVFDRVVRALGFDPRDEMTAMYGEGD